MPVQPLSPTHNRENNATMQTRKTISIQFLRTLFFLGLTPAFAWSGTFTVSPVRIQLSTSKPNAILQITNRDDQPVTIQAHVVAWSFNAQNDTYTESDDVMLNPPIAVIGPHQSQFIRLGLRHPNVSQQERSYRVILDEVPQPVQTGFRGVQTVLRLSIPIFALPKQATASQLSWQISRASDSHLRLVAVNHGTAHVQIKSLDVVNAESADNYLKGTPPAYLLPNQQREWLIQDERAGTTKRIKVLAVTDAGISHEIIDVAPQ